MAQQQKKRIVTVGGGFASVKLALELSNDDNFEVTLIAPHDQLEYHGALYRSATGRSPLEVVVPFQEIFKDAKNVTLVNDFVTDLRASTKEVKGQSGRVYSYDALVLGLGYEIEYYGIRGAREHTQTMYTIYDTIRLRNAMKELFIKKKGHECSLVVIGAGPTGVELAGDISAFAEMVSKVHDIPAAKPKVTVVDRANRLLPMLNEKVSAITKKRMDELGVKFIGAAVVDHCTSRHMCLSDGTVVPADLTIWTAGSRANPFFERYPDIFSLDPKKRVVVNEFLQANTPAIYVLGDAASTKFSGMAQTAISDAVQLANNFKRFVHGEELKKYRAHTPVYVVPVGPEWAVAQQGDQVVAGAEGWKIRRDADYFVLTNFLPPKLAKEHWNKALQAADI